MCHLPILVYLTHHRLHVNIKRPKKETWLSSHIFNTNAGNMTSGKTKIWLHKAGWFLSTSISPDKKPRLPDLLPTWRLDLLRTNASWPVRGGVGEQIAPNNQQQPLEGLKRVEHIGQIMFPRFFPREHWKRQACKVHDSEGVVHDSESDDSSDCWNCFATKRLQKSYQRHDSLDIILSMENLDLCSGTFSKKKSFPGARRVLVKSCIEMWS